MDSWYQILPRDKDGQPVITVDTHRQNFGVSPDVLAASEKRSAENTEMFMSILYKSSPSLVAIAPGDLWSLTYVHLYGIYL